MKLVNKKAKFDYFLTENLEVGLVLHASEVKAIIEHNLSLKESYVKIIGSEKPEVWLIGAHVNGVEDELRDKKLLLHKSQIKKFQKLLRDVSTTLIMYEVYTDENGRLKGTLCLAKGQKTYDKREVIKQRDLDRSNG